MTGSATHLKPLMISCLDDNPINHPIVVEIHTKIKSMKDLCSQLQGPDSVSSIA